MKCSIFFQIIIELSCVVVYNMERIFRFRMISNSSAIHHQLPIAMWLNNFSIANAILYLSLFSLVYLLHELVALAMNKSRHFFFRVNSKWLRMFSFRF